MRSGRSDRNKNTSKFISLILRHKPETIGITLDEHGWADVRQMEADGYRFFESANHVWLTKEAPVKYLTKEEIN